MTTKVKKVTKKATKKVTKKNIVNNVVLTAAQARSIQTYMLKNGKNYKFLDTKINALV